MADINISPQRGLKKGIVRHSTKVDMTPMVDLGFLLITFFIFTAVMEKPKAMKLILPVDGLPTDVPKSKTITVLSGGNNSIVCYEGLANENPIVSRFNSTAPTAELRNFITAKREQMRGVGASPDSLIVVIKPGEESDYRQLMYILDEMSICEVKRHALARQDEWDKELLSARH